MATARRRDMGIAGAVVILSQVLTNYQSTNTVATEIRELKDAIQDIRKEQRTTFARKEQLKSLETSMDEVKSELQEIKKQIRRLSNQYAEAELEDDFGDVCITPVAQDLLVERI